MQEQAFYVIRNYASSEEDIDVIFHEVDSEKLVEAIVDALESKTPDVVVQVGFSLPLFIFDLFHDLCQLPSTPSTSAVNSIGRLGALQPDKRHTGPPISHIVQPRDPPHSPNPPRRLANHRSPPRSCRFSPRDRENEPLEARRVEGERVSEHAETPV